MTARLNAIASFSAWLSQRMVEKGWTASALSRAAGLNASTIRNLLRGVRPTESTARALAAQLGADPDEVAAGLGYANVRLVAADPATFEGSWTEYVRATLILRRESVAHAAKGAGIPIPTLKSAITGGNPHMRTSDAVAVYFGIRAGPLRKLRPKNPGRVARGKAYAARRGPDWMREFAQKGRDSREAHISGMRSSELWGPDHYTRISAMAADKRRNGRLYICAYCHDESRPIWRCPSALRRTLDHESFVQARIYHRSCFKQHRKDTRTSGFQSTISKLGWISARIAGFGDSWAKSYVKEHSRAAVNDANFPGTRAARPSRVLINSELAVQIYMGREYGGYSAREIESLLGLKPTRDSRGNKTTNRQVQRLFRFGRAIAEGHIREDTADQQQILRVLQPGQLAYYQIGKTQSTYQAKRLLSLAARDFGLKLLWRRSYRSDAIRFEVRRCRAG